MKLRIILEPQEEGGYTVYIPSLPGCVSQGETVEEAMQNIKEAAEIYIESIKARELPLIKIEERELELSV